MDIGTKMAKLCSNHEGGMTWPYWMVYCPRCGKALEEKPPKKKRDSKGIPLLK